MYISSYLLSFTAKFGKSCLHLLIFFLPFSFIDSPSLIWILPHSSMKTLLQSLPVIFLVFNWRGCVIIFLSLTLQPFVETLSFPWLLWYFFLTSFFSQLLLLYLITKTQESFRFFLFRTFLLYLPVFSLPATSSSIMISTNIWKPVAPNSNLQFRFLSSRTTSRTFFLKHPSDTSWLLQTEHDTQKHPRVSPVRNMTVIVGLVISDPSGPFSSLTSHDIQGLTSLSSQWTPTTSALSLSWTGVKFSKLVFLYPLLMSVLHTLISDEF